jgi:hypothetical protein
MNVPASTLIEYKYIRKNNGVVTWESDPNNQFSSPANGTFGKVFMCLFLQIILLTET